MRWPKGPPYVALNPPYFLLLFLFLFFLAFLSLFAFARKTLFSPYKRACLVSF